LLFLLCTAAALSQTRVPLSLHEAIDIAIRTNPEAVAAKRSIGAAQGRFWQGISPPPPVISVTYDYIPTGSGLARFGERVIGISQSFDFPTTMALRGSALTSEIRATEADSRSVAYAIRMQVTEAYYGVLAKQQRLTLAEENLRIAVDFEQKASIRHAVGEGTNLEQLTARVQKTQAQSELESSQNELGKAVNELHFALGRGTPQPEKEFLLVDSLKYRSFDYEIDSMLARAYGSNSQLQAAAFRMDAAADNRGIAWSSLLPSFNASYAGYRYAAGATAYGVALGISVPVWFLFDQRGRIQEATAAYSKAEAELSARRNLVDAQVRNAVLDVRNADRQVRLYQEELLPQAEEIHRVAVSSYQAGESTYLEFLQARQTLISVRATSIEALLKYQSAVARLEYSVGMPIKE
jgi:cobalt-zinc-cadmium efflux system outer membrane protein